MKADGPSSKLDVEYTLTVLKRKATDEKVAKKSKWKKVDGVAIEDGDNRGGSKAPVGAGRKKSIQAFSLVRKGHTVKAINVFEKGDGDNRAGKEVAADGGDLALRKEQSGERARSWSIISLLAYS